MSIIASFMVPHPPLIIPEIGRGEEKQVEKTIKSYEKVAEEIAKLNPETIIISSPHAPYYSDYFYISSEEVSGSFKRFGASDVSFKEEIDKALVEEIINISEKIGFPTGKTQTEGLDHGTMVPLYFIRKKLPNTKIIVVGLSELSLVTHYQFGKIIKKAVDNLDKKVVFVASGDLSHKLQEYGPYGFTEEGPIYDERIMDTMSHARFNELFTYDLDFLERVAQCGHRSFIIMAGALDGKNVETQELSHEDITGVGYGICTFYPKDDNKDRMYKDSGDIYVKLARETINNYITNNTINKDNLPEELLKEQAGVFVSIHEFGMLRGCIGTITATTDSIAEEIITNAISASTRDYRFNPITKEELEYLEINVDVLTPPEDIESKEMLNPKEYGVIVTQGYKRGLLLPDLEGIDDIDLQISIAKQKAGITSDDYSLQRFKVIRHK